MQRYNQILGQPHPQSEQADPRQVPNSAGGWSFDVDKWAQLRRFLILGTVGGTYYIKEQKLTETNVAALDACIAEDASAVVALIASVSVGGLALRQDPALFALAKLAAAHNQGHALEVLQDVCRIPTHLFKFMTYYNELGGKSNASTRRAIGNWYTSKTDEQLIYHMLKYQSRERMSNTDLINFAHPKPRTLDQHTMFEWAIKGSVLPENETDAARKIRAVKAVHSSETPNEVKAQLIEAHRLTREMIPTELMKNHEVLDALTLDMPVTALMRSLGQFTQCGYIGPMSMHMSHIVAKLTSPDALRRGRVHPLAVWLALKTYASGRGVRGSGSWTPEDVIVQALEVAFEQSFKNVQPTGLRTLYSLDVSGSMTAQAGDMAGVSCFEAGFAMLYIMAKTEPACVLTTFDTVCRRVQVPSSTLGAGYNWGGGTDIAQPFIWALRNKVPVDLFVVFTDSETWAGGSHPHEALQRYRREMNIPARCVLCAAVANTHSVVPDDNDVLNVVGFDASLPQLISGFAKREF